MRNGGGNNTALWRLYNTGKILYQRVNGGLAQPVWKNGSNNYSVKSLRDGKNDIGPKNKTTKTVYVFLNLSVTLLREKMK